MHGTFSPNDPAEATINAVLQPFLLTKSDGIVDVLYIANNVLIALELERGGPSRLYAKA